MIDLKTMLLLEFTTTAFMATAWMLVWIFCRQIYELKVIAAGFVAIAVGLFLYLQRGPDPSLLRIVTDNMVIKFGLVLWADGLARFLGQKRYLWIGTTCLIAQFVSWTAAVTFVPENLAVRIHASTAITTVMMGLMIRTLAVDRSQPRFLRWITIALLAEYVGASLLQSALVHWHPATFANRRVLSDINAWYFFQGHVFITGFFICLVFMVGMRLSMDLRDRNSALAREISIRRRLEQELSTSLEGEKTARKEQRQLMRMVSHEFRTPLAAIRYASDMLSVMLPNPEEPVSRRIRGIDEAVSRMTMLIDRFLSSERQEEGVLKIETVDIPALVSDIQQHFEHAALGKRLTFTGVVRLPGFQADVEMLKTVIVNLIDNALKYSGVTAPVEVDFSVRDDRLVIEVADRGIGIPEEEIGQIGFRFYRASNTSGTGGSGLGLHTCRQLLDYHDGGLELHRREHGGTLARLHLPRAGPMPKQTKERMTVEAE
ncbi:sensor histidine kinase [Roseibium sp.]|uniref:sensor histidine kinase n=1 Tax=Roseibium sp. TaxID=1936156 RepID=UPI003A968B99